MSLEQGAEMYAAKGGGGRRAKCPLMFMANHPPFMSGVSPRDASAYHTASDRTATSPVGNYTVATIIHKPGTYKMGAWLYYSDCNGYQVRSRVAAVLLQYTGLGRL